MNRSSQILVLAACAATLSQAGAQNPKSVIGTSCALEAGKNALNGGGAYYRAKFDQDGLVFTPALGRRASKTFPSRFRMRTIRRGGRRVAVANQVAPKLSEMTAVYDHGGGIVERYHVRPEGVEVTYTFAKKPQGSGDLTVRLAIDTELRLAGLKANGAIRMHAADLGGISIGSVTGVDANGRKAEGSSRIVDGTLELTLPAAFVESAAYPMVLDPLIGTDFLVGSNAENDQLSDVAYGVNNGGRYLVVWQRSFGGVDIEIRAQRVSAGGSKIGSFIAITNSSNIAVGAAVGYVRKTSRFLVCWQQAAAINGNWNVMCRSVDPSDGSKSGIVSVVSSAAAETHVDVSTDRRTSDDEAIVVWQSPSGIRARAITVPATGDPTKPGTVKAVTSTAGDRRPAITKSGGATGRYVVVYERKNIAGRWGISARPLSSSATPSAPEINLGSLSFRDSLRPQVDGDGTRFMAVWQRTEGTTSSKHDIRGRRLRWDGSKLVLEGSQLDLESGLNDDESEPDVTFLGTKYAVIWTDVNGANNRVIGLKTFDRLTGALCSTTSSISGPFSNNVNGAIASRWSGGSGSDEALITFTSQDPSASFKGNLRGQRMEAVGAGGTSTDLGGGCGLGGSLSAQGPCAIGNTGFGLRLQGAAPSAPSALLNLTVPAPPFVVCGGCQITNPTILFPKPLSNGGGTLFLPIPCDVGLIGSTLQWQYYVLGSGTTPCSAAQGVSFSNRLSTTIGQ